MKLTNFVAAFALLAVLVVPAQAQFLPSYGGGYSPIQPFHVERSIDKVTGKVLPITEIMFGGQVAKDGFSDGWMTSVLTPGMKVVPINSGFYIRSHMDVVGDAIDNSVDRGDDRKKFKRDGHSDYNDGHVYVGNAGRDAHDEGALGQTVRFFLAEQLPGEGVYNLRFLQKFKGGSQHWEIQPIPVGVHGNSPENTSMAYDQVLACYFSPARTFNMRKMSGPLGPTIYRAWAIWKAGTYGTGADITDPKQVSGALGFLVQVGFFGNVDEVDPDMLYLAGLSSDPRIQATAAPSITSSTTTVEDVITATHKGNRITIMVKSGQALVVGGGKTFSLTQGQTQGWNLGTGVTVNGHPDTYYLERR